MLKKFKNISTTQIKYLPLLSITLMTFMVIDAPLRGRLVFFKFQVGHESIKLKEKEQKVSLCSLFRVSNTSGTFKFFISYKGNYVTVGHGQKRVRNAEVGEIAPILSVRKPKLRCQSSLLTQLGQTVWCQAHSQNLSVTYRLKYFPKQLYSCLCLFKYIQFHSNYYSY